MGTYRFAKRVLYTKKIKLQKIKSGYFSFQGGDFPPMRCVKTRSFLLCYAEPMKYFLKKFSGRGGHLTRARATHPKALYAYTGFSTVDPAMSRHVSGKAFAKSAIFNTVRKLISLSLRLLSHMYCTTSC